MSEYLFTNSFLSLDFEKHSFSIDMREKTHLGLLLLYIMIVLVYNFNLFSIYLKQWMEKCFAVDFLYVYMLYMRVVEKVQVYIEGSKFSHSMWTI